MKLKLIIFFALYQLTTNAQVIGNPDNFNRKSPFQLSFIYPIGTNGIYSYEKTNNLSFNLLLGINGGVEGIEMGSFINVNRYDVKGIQLAAFGSFNGGDMGGIQLSGFGNVNMGNVRGLQGAGFINVNRQSDQLIQLSGFANITESYGGVQASGFINIAKDAGLPDTVQLGDSDNFIKPGVQLAGFANIAENVNGIQGAGFINVAKNVKGVQLAGFINICDSMDGIALAPINFIRKNGYRKISVWSNEFFYVNTSYKMGIEKFYTIFNLGYRPETGRLNWSGGIGFGTVFTMMNDNNIDLEINSHTIIDDLFWEDDYYWDSHNLYQLKFSFRHQAPGKIGFFGGPTFNWLFSRNEAEIRDVVPAWAVKYQYQYHVSFLWFGFNAGIQF